MYRTKRLVSLLVVSVALLGAASVVSAGNDASDLAGRVKVWQTAFNAGDKDAVAALYTADAARLPYQAPAVEGQAAIPANVQTSYDMGATKIALEVVGSESQGNMAWGQGTFVLTDAEGAVVLKGKWLNVSKKVGGQWKIHRDIWNTDAPEQ